MFELKLLSIDAIPEALEKAERYRLLNEPAEAESICLDVLKADPENQKALITLLLAVSDRFGKGYGVGATQAKELLGRVKGAYEHAYYSGILAERRAKARLAQAEASLASARNCSSSPRSTRAIATSAAACRSPSWRIRCR